MVERGAVVDVIGGSEDVGTTAVGFEDVIAAVITAGGAACIGVETGDIPGTLGASCEVGGFGASVG